MEMGVASPRREVLHRRDLDPLHRNPHHPAAELHLHRSVLPQVPQHGPLGVHLATQQCRLHPRIQHRQNAPLLRPVHDEIDRRDMLRVHPLRPPGHPGVRVQTRHEPAELLRCELPLHQPPVSTDAAPSHHSVPMLGEVLIRPGMAALRQVADIPGGPSRPHDPHPGNRHKAMVHCVRYEIEGLRAKERGTP